MYNLAYFHVYKTMNVHKICVKLEILEHQRHIPVHQLAEILETEKSRWLRHIFWQDVMSPTKLDPKLQPSKHAQKNICMTLEKSFTIITSRWQKSTSEK